MNRKHKILFYSVKLLIWLSSAIFLLTGAVGTLRAEPPQQQGEGCFSGEYVLTRSIVAAKNRKAVDAVNEVSQRRLHLAQETVSALLVTEDPGATARMPEERRVVSPNLSRVCGWLRQRNREQRRRRSRERTSAIVRRINCDCNGVISLLKTPDDPHYGLQWGLHQSNDIDMDMPQAWNITTGSHDTIVAVIDTGIDYTHPDLHENIWVNPGEIYGNGIDDDQNGYIDDIHGVNVITNSGNPMDDNGHGTHVAGIIGAIGNNSRGVTGVNWQIKMIGVKFLNSAGSGTLFDAVKAIDYVTDLKNRGHNIIASNNSWGGGGYYVTLAEAIERARVAGVLFIAAAGNEGKNIDNTPSYPASYTSSNIISVAAIDAQGNLASFSNYGANTVEIAAPGAQIASTYPGNQYVYMSGTSMAAPHVTGAVALLASYSPQLSWQELKDSLLLNSVQLTSLTGLVSTGAMANAHNMLQASTPPPPPSPSPTPTPTPTPTPSVTPTPEPTPEPTPGSWSISGEVVDKNGYRLAGVSVTLEAGELKNSTTTGPDGVFSFPSVDGPLEVKVSAKKSGYLFAETSWYLNSNTALTIEGEVAERVVTALVLQSSGEPLAGVEITCSSNGTKITDSNGQVFFNLPHGATYQLTAAAEAFHFDRNDLTGTLFGDVERVFVAKGG